VRFIENDEIELHFREARSADEAIAALVGREYDPRIATHQRERSNRPLGEHALAARRSDVVAMLGDWADSVLNLKLLHRTRNRRGRAAEEARGKSRGASCARREWAVLSTIDQLDGRVPCREAKCGRRKGVRSTNFLTSTECCCQPNAGCSKQPQTASLPH